MLAINLSSAEFFFQATTTAKSEDIAAYFADLIQHYHQRGVVRMDIFLDRNTTHKEKMQPLLAELRAQEPPTAVTVQFRLMPAYSPKLNPVEYAIHLLRLRCLHHADATKALPQAIERITEACKQGTVLFKQQIKNLIRHITSLVKKNTL